MRQSFQRMLDAYAESNHDPETSHLMHTAWLHYLVIRKWTTNTSAGAALTLGFLISQQVKDPSKEDSNNGWSEVRFDDIKNDLRPTDSELKKFLRLLIKKKLIKTRKCADESKLLLWIDYDLLMKVTDDWNATTGVELNRMLQQEKDAHNNKS